MYLCVILYSIRLCPWQIERLLLQSDLRLFACLASTSALLTSTLGYPYLRRYSYPPVTYPPAFSRPFSERSYKDKGKQECSEKKERKEKKP
jgi:hypothetical protein